MEKIISSEKELVNLAKEILKFAKGIKVFTLYGNLGAGKTTLVKQLCKQLNVKDETSSPTYSIVNEYQNEQNKVYHIDLYRLNSLEEAFEVGLEDYLESGNYCFIEWPQIAKAILPEKIIEIRLEKIDETSRKCTFNTLE
ncbi:MAG: tRNA (adenosine(37)-N6)-threonylcarbamoyltransferase complex ATPase subunit type 1 TsaE [Chitinophagales bacterium]